MDFKLPSIKDLFPKKADKLEKEEKKENYTKMFAIPLEERKKVVETIIAIVDEAKRQREAFMEIRAESIRNYEGNEQIKGPWKDSSNISTMITTISCDTMHAKIFPMVWNPDRLYFRGTEKHDDVVAENNKIMMQWAITKDMEDTQYKADEIVHRFLIDGTVAVKQEWEVYYTYVTRMMPKSVDDKGKIKYEAVYDRIRRERCKWRIKDLDYVYLPFNAENAQTAEYIIEENYYTYPMLQEMMEKGLILKDVDMEEVKSSIEKTFDPEGTVKERYGAAGFETYNARLESYPIKTYEAFLKYDINKDNKREECVFIILPDQKIYMAGKPLHTISRRGRRPWRIEPFIRRPGVIYGKGIPELVRQLHKEMNLIHNQRINAGNMVLAPFFFYRAASGLEPDKLEIRPATGIPLDDPQRDIYFPPYNASNLSVSFQEENIIMDLIAKLTFITPPMMGEETANRPTARGTMAIIAQGETKFVLLAARVQKFIADLISDTRKMYEENMPEGTEQRILGTAEKGTWGKLSPETIAGDYDCFMEIDLEAGNLMFEKQADQLIFNTLVQDPFVNQNPAYAWELRANYLKSLGKKNYDKIIGPKPDVELNAGDAEDENILMSQDRPEQVMAEDDHLAHMNSHAQFKRELGSTLTPESLSIITAHLLEHRMMYTQNLQQLSMQQGDQQNGQGQEGMAGPLNAPRMGVVQGGRINGQNGGQPPRPPVGSVGVPGGTQGVS